LQEIGLDIQYSISQFVWDNIMVNMVPCGYWMQQKIDSTTKAWHQLGKANAAKATEEL
jgi:hypothetical protein